MVSLVTRDISWPVEVPLKKAAESLVICSNNLVRRSAIVRTAAHWRK